MRDNATFFAHFHSKFAKSENPNPKYIFLNGFVTKNATFFLILNSLRDYLKIIREKAKNFRQDVKMEKIRICFHAFNFFQEHCYKPASMTFKSV